MEIIAKKYNERFWLESVMSRGSPFLVLVLISILILIYGEEKRLLQLSAIVCLILVLFYYINKIVYLVRPTNILTLSDNNLFYHKTKKIVIKIVIDEVTHVTTNRYRKKSEYPFGTIVIHTKRNNVRIPWVANIKEVETRILLLIKDVTSKKQWTQ